MKKDMMGEFLKTWNRKYFKKYDEQNRQFHKMAYKFRDLLMVQTWRYIDPNAKMQNFNVGLYEFSFYITFNGEYIYYTYKVPTDQKVDIYHDKSLVSHKAKDKHDTQGEILETISLANTFTFALKKFKGERKMKHRKVA